MPAAKASPKSKDNPYTKSALKYARDVTSGKILACKWVRLACQRHLDDLEKAKSKSYPYRFDPELAARVCTFIEQLPHVKGRWAARRERLKLQPWQIFILSCLFGWVFRDTGLRRYRQAYVCVPRKNGKSPMAAGIGLYMLACDNEAGAEVYCGATSEKQAWEVFKPAREMAQRTPEMLSALGVDVHAKSLTVAGNGSKFEPVIGRPGDGAAPSLGICDEFHEAVNADLFDTLLTGMVGREQPLLLVITTAGTDLGSPCYDYQTHAQKVLEGTLEDEQLFAVIYGIDPEDDWTTEAALRKANPNLDVSVDLAALRHDQQIAIQNSSKANIVKTKHLNIWCNASVGWMNLVKWHTCADASLKPEQFTKSDECWIGLDLASKIDIAATVKLFRKEVNGQMHFYAMPRLYLPEERAMDPTLQVYQKWVHDGHLIATEGNVIDHRRILDDLVADASAYTIRELGFDPYNAEMLTQELRSKSGVTTTEVPQTVKFLSEPMKQLEALVLSGRFHHDGNPVMTWCIANVVAHIDANDNIFPRKDKIENKIDGAVALIIALSRALAAPAAKAVWFKPFVL